MKNKKCSIPVAAINYKMVSSDFKENCKAHKMSPYLFSQAGNFLDSTLFGSNRKSN